MVKILFYDTKPYDKKLFEDYNKHYGFEIKYLESKLNNETAPLAAGYDAVCIFVNDIADKETLEILKNCGVKLVVLRCAGFNNVDIQNLPEGSYSTDINNIPKIKFSNKENFKIFIPTNKILENIEGNIKISGKLKTYPVFYGESFDEQHQDYALTYDAFENISAEAILKINAYKSKLKIYKTDSETNKPIEGVEFNFKYNNGKNIGNYKTDKNGIIEINNLRQGKIVITEIKTQNQYILDENKREIILEYEGEKEVKIENSRKKGNINILKVDKDDNKATIEGVEFDLLDSTGKNIIKHVKTDKNGKAEIKNLDIGKYILRETKTRKECKIALEQNITIEWGKTLNLTIENEDDVYRDSRSIDFLQGEDLEDIKNVRIEDSK